jgi:hypothetical protein
MPICTTKNEINLITANSNHIKFKLTLDFKSIISKYNNRELIAVNKFIVRIYEWMQIVPSSNWIAVCVSINMLIKYVQIDNYNYKTANQEMLTKKAIQMDQTIGLISCLSLEMFGDYGLTNIFHKKYKAEISNIYNDIIIKLYPNYIYFPIYKNYYRDIISIIIYNIKSNATKNSTSKN